MNWSRLGASWETLAVVVISTLGVFTAIVIYTRIVGLRSYSKMSSFDFAVTVALGSMMASVGLSSSSLVSGATAIGTLYLTQLGIAVLRRVWRFSKIVDNQPLVLMAGKRYVSDNLRKAKVTEDDVRGKLREANVYNYEDLRAVVMETTGDISVLHGSGHIDLDIFQGVLDQEELEKEEEGGGVRDSDRGQGGGEDESSSDGGTDAEDPGGGDQAQAGDSQASGGDDGGSDGDEDRDRTDDDADSRGPFPVSRRRRSDGLADPGFARPTRVSRAGEGPLEDQAAPSAPETVRPSVERTFTGMQTFGPEATRTPPWREDEGGDQP